MQSSPPSERYFCTFYFPFTSNTAFFHPVLNSLFMHFQPVILGFVLDGEVCLGMVWPNIGITEYENICNHVE